MLRSLLDSSPRNRRRANAMAEIQDKAGFAHERELHAKQMAPE
jgi:hypothetical protein